MTRSVFPTGYEWAILWCIAVQKLCVFVRVRIRAPTRTVNGLAVIDETPQKAVKRIVANQREGD